MAKAEKDPIKKQSELTKKAVLRAEKLERTLTKLVAQSEPGSPAEGFLKAVQGGLKAIRKNAKPEARADIAAKKEQPAKAAKTTKKPVKKAAAKQPAAADIRPPVEASEQE